MSDSADTSSSVDFESAEEGSELETASQTNSSMPATEDDVFETSGCNQAEEAMEVEDVASASTSKSASLSTTASSNNNKEDEDSLWAKLPDGTKEICERATGLLYMERYETFVYSNWPYEVKKGNLCNPRKLAEAGLSFYSLEPSPTAQCQICFTIIRNLQPNSDPWSLHAEASPDCYLIQLGERQGVDDYSIDELLGIALNKIINEATQTVKEKENTLKKRLFQLRNKELQQEAM